MNFFKKPETIIKVIEIEKSAPLGDTIPQEAIETLQHHPGFQYLLAKLRVSQAALKAKLTRETHKDMREVDILQAGIFWSGWLERQIAASVNRIKVQDRARSAVEEELAEFEKVAKTLVEVGV